MNDVDPPKTETSEAAPETPPEAASSVPAAEIAEIGAIDDSAAFYRAEPKLKDYLTSPDAPSRYLMVLSGLFAFLAIACLTLLVVQYLKYRHLGQKAEVNVTETIKIEPTFHTPLGQFVVVWEDSEMRADLSAECTKEEACTELKTRFEAVHDLLLPLLQGSSRTEMLNPSRKLHLRQELADKLNELKLKGQIIEVDFSDLTIELRK